jgi:phosphohistidine phosphatase
MAARLLATGLSLECILSSSARRAMETAAAFAQAAGINVVAVNALYHAEPDAYLNALRELPETVMQVAVFGHNPGMSMIAHNIAPARAHEVPTCGLIVAEADTTSWSDLDWVDLKWVAFMTPKDGSDA